MPRQARQPSQSGIYHLMIRGINKQSIFEDDADRKKFMWCLQHYKEVSQYTVYGYCLMDNHVHLLIKEGLEPIAKSVKRIGVSYVSWFNQKYGRCGHLFQDRFKSEAVETNEYFLIVLRYIHQNPIKIGKEQKLETYPWSSYPEYSKMSSLIDIDFVLGMFSPKPEVAIDMFKEFMNEKSADNTIMVYSINKLTDQEAKAVIQKLTQLTIPTELQTMEKEKRNELLRQIKKSEGISTRQIARLTGITQSIIVRA